MGVGLDVGDGVGCLVGLSVLQLHGGQYVGRTRGKKVVGCVRGADLKRDGGV
jgi:hypothetical protein